MDEPSARQRLIEAAYHLFAEKGIDDAPTRRIAECAGVNEVTLFRLFENKLGLVESVIDDLLDTISPDLIVPPQSIVTEEVLVRVARQLSAAYVKHADLIRFIVINMRHAPSVKDVFRARFFMPQMAFAVALLGDAADAMKIDRLTLAFDFMSPLIMRGMKNAMTGTLDPLPTDEEFSESHAKIFAILVEHSRR